MGYYLKAFIGRLEDLEKVKGKFQNAKTISLTDEIALTPMTKDLFNEINNYRTNNEIGKYEFLTTDVENEILMIINDGMISYVEVEYWGGEGGQSGIIWKEGKRIFEKDFEQEVVNAILRQFGIVRSKLRDEFDTVGLGRERNTEDWILLAQ